MSVLALVYIGSSAVSGGLVADKKLVFAAERRCRFQEKLDPKLFLDTVAGALKQVLNDLLTAKISAPPPAKVVVFLSSPFVASQLNILRHNAEKPFKVTEQLVGDLIAQNIAKFKNDPEHAVVDSKIMRFTLNGYNVTAPHGQKVTGLEIAHHLSIAATPVLKKFREIICAACHRDVVEFHSAAFAAYSAVCRLQLLDQNFLLLDVGGEITELSLVWQGVLQETFSYPLGHHDLLRRLTAAGETPASARTALQLSPPGGAKLKAIQGEWLERFTAGLKQIVHRRFWSGDIVLVAEEETLLPLVSEWLSLVPLDRIVFRRRKVVIQSLRPAVLSRFVSVAPGVKARLNLLLSALFVLK